MNTNQQLVSLEEIRSHIESAAKDTVLAKIELGRWLQMARDHFKADQEFGKWRQENIPWMAQQRAEEHMRVFKKFGHRLTGGQPGYTVLELLARDTTPEVTVERVLEDPEGWTVKDVKEQIKADREDIEGPPPKREIVTTYQKVWNLLSEAVESEAARVCHDWLAQAGASSEVVSKGRVRWLFRQLSQAIHPDKVQLKGPEQALMDAMIALNQMRKELLG